MFLGKVKGLFHSKYVTSFYERYENRISLLALALGFFLDSLFLVQVDKLGEQVVLTTYILISGLAIFFISKNESEDGSKVKNDRAHFWQTLCLQFALGGLFSAYVIFYARGATLESTWPYLIVLGAYFLGNEFLKKHYLRFSFRLSIYFFALLLYFVIIVPALLKSISSLVFIFSTLLAVITFRFFVRLLQRYKKDGIKKTRKIRIIYYATTLLIINIFYFANIIPPLPLLLKDTGVYHNLIPKGDGGYIVSAETPSGLFDLFSSKDVFHRYSYEPVYVFTAVYSPVDLNTNVIHNWQWFDESKNRWVTASNVSVPIRGGRQDGYRLYSFKYNLTEGLWRVNVLTNNSRLIGRVKFEVVDVDYIPNTNIIHK